MRILLVAGLDYENPSAEAVLNGLGKAYRRHGHSVRAVSLCLKGGSSRAGRKMPWGRLLSFNCDWQALLVRELRRADVAHFHSYHGHLEERVVAFWRACRAAKASPLVSFQGYGDPWGVTPDAKERALMGVFLSEARRVTALSRFCARQIENDVPALAKRVAVVPDGYDPEEMKMAKPALRGGAYVACVARHSDAKGIDVLLKAWKLVFPRANVVLRIAGPDRMVPRGRFKRQARRLGIAGGVRFLGQVSRRRVWSEIGGSLFTVHPSRYEAFGMAVLEAMAAGKAVVATRSGGPEELVTHGVSGVLVPPGNAAALAAAILRLVRNPDWRKRLEAGARREAGNYRWDLIAGRYLGLLRSNVRGRQA